MALVENNITLDNIMQIGNITGADPLEFILNINTLAFDGWLFFIMLTLLGFLLFRKAQQFEDQPTINLMYVSTALTIISFFARALYLVKGGVLYALITDFQLWIFPLIATICATIVKFNNR